MRLVHVALLSVIVLATAMPATAPAIASGQPSKAPEAIEKMVDVGGYGLYFSVIPGKGPVILLEAGGGMDSTE